MTKMWSGRFREPLDPDFERWQRSFPYDQRLLPYELAASRAHARALEHAGVLSSEELAEILQRLTKFADSSTSVVLETIIPLRNPIPAQQPAAAAKLSARNGRDRAAV